METSNNVASLFAPHPATAKTFVEDTQERFLKLLITQMRNQDPLKPLDNAEVTTQLAQLNTVTGINKLNDTVELLSGNFATNQTLQAASLIGRQILVPGSGLTLKNGSAVGGIALTEPADQVVVSIKDGSGQIVHSRDLGPHEAGNIAFQWDGNTDAGTAAPEGIYSVSLKALRANENVSAQALTYGTVGSVSADSRGVTVDVLGIGTVGLSDIKQIL
ncbi:MAG: flagellar hook assembly protein FlgD [Burkholderiales bacterium]